MLRVTGVQCDFLSRGNALARHLTHGAVFGIDAGLQKLIQDFPCTTNLSLEVKTHLSHQEDSPLTKGACPRSQLCPPPQGSPYHLGSNLPSLSLDFSLHKIGRGDSVTLPHRPQASAEAICKGRSTPPQDTFDNSRSVQSSTVARNHMWLVRFKFKLILNKLKTVPQTHEPHFSRTSPSL